MIRSVVWFTVALIVIKYKFSKQCEEWEKINNISLACFLNLICTKGQNFNYHILNNKEAAGCAVNDS